jgi:hypothetical protein
MRQHSRTDLCGGRPETVVPTATAFSQLAGLIGVAVFGLREFAPSPRRRLNAASDLSPNEVDEEVTKVAPCPRPATAKIEQSRLAVCRRAIDCPSFVKQRHTHRCIDHSPGRLG